ncbi:MAG: TonB-dependent receptor [Chitinophagales bacterium]
MIKYFLFILYLCPTVLFAQQITGTITNADNEFLIGANIYWQGTTTGTITNENGFFELEKTAETPQNLIISFVGYVSDTLLIENQNEITSQLLTTEELDAVVITGQEAGMAILATPIKTEVITEVELQKAACCDLAGCFSTQITVQPQTTNVITNSKELRILGLSGVYNQVLLDGLPQIQGLSYTYGVSSVPGTLVDNIYVSKGANSVLQGYESISGQINVLTKNGDNDDRLLFNLYANSFAETQANVNYAMSKNNWSNLTAFHTAQPATKMDKDDDTFLDMPKLTRYMLSNKIEYGQNDETNWKTSITTRVLDEKRIGGQIDFDAKKDKGSDEIYGQTVELQQADIWSKTSYKINQKHQMSLMLSGFHQQQNSFFGTVKYDASQTNMYANIQHEWNYRTNFSLKTGISQRYLNLNEDIAFTTNELGRTYDGNYKKKEAVTGIFAENTANFLDDKLHVTAGMRADYHNDFGWQFTPRVLGKYDFTDKLDFRASIGTGWRTVNLFSENVGLLVSSRNIIFEEALRPEKALNWGVSMTQKFETENIYGYFSSDFYRTDFQNQIFPDYDSNPTEAIVKNFEETSTSNGFQTDFYIEFWEKLDFKLGYNFLDVFRKVNEGKILLPFNSAHRFLATVGYQTPNEKFHIDASMHWYGKQRLPNTTDNIEDFQRPDFSKAYTTFNTQISYNVGKFEWYAGCENIFDFRQKRPIISWENPFSPYFDTSSVWGPTRGREMYIGMRFRLAKK